MVKGDAVTESDIRAIFDSVDLGKEYVAEHISREELDQQYSLEALYEMIEEWVSDHFDNFDCYPMEFAVFNHDGDEIYVMEYEEYWKILDHFGYKTP